VDISPAAIAHAQARAATSTGTCRYLLDDLRATEVDGEFDLVLLLYGEINTFDSSDITAIMSTIERCLAPDGLAIIETSTEVGVRRKASRPSTWYLADGGLFASGPHLVLSASGWDSAEEAVERWNIIDEDERLTRYETTTWLLDDPRIEAILASSKLRVVERFADLTGARFDPDGDLQTLKISHT
jgi:hypothetical protein